MALGSQKKSDKAVSGISSDQLAMLTRYINPHLQIKNILRSGGLPQAFVSTCDSLNQEWQLGEVTANV